MKRTCPDIQSDREAKKRLIEDLQAQIDKAHETENQLTNELQTHPNFLAFVQELRHARLKDYLGDFFYTEWVQKLQLLMISVEHDYQWDGHRSKHFGIFKILFENERQIYKFKYGKDVVDDNISKITLLDKDAVANLWDNLPELWSMAVKSNEQNEGTKRPKSAIFAVLIALDMHEHDATSVSGALLKKQGEYALRQLKPLRLKNEEALEEEERAEELNKKLTWKEPV